MTDRSDGVQGWTVSILTLGYGIVVCLFVFMGLFASTFLSHGLADLLNRLADSQLREA